MLRIVPIFPIFLLYIFVSHGKMEVAGCLVNAGHSAEKFLIMYSVASDINVPTAAKRFNNDQVGQIQSNQHAHPHAQP